VLPIYVGDDITDEDAFHILSGRGVSLVVRDPEDRRTAADYALADVDDVKRFLRFLTTIAREVSAAERGTDG
jgi:alpha,alpha-trehalase